MKIAIMQPYFFPYLGYFSLIKHTDRFILLDKVQFIRHGWIERNRILKQSEGWIYIQVPIIKEKGRDTSIREIKINNTQNWQQKIIAQLQHYKRIAPYYSKIINLLDEVLRFQFTDIVSLNKASLEMVCNYLGIDHHISVFSEMNIEIAKPNAPDEWALNICKNLGNVNEYWNPQGGESFFDKQKYSEAGLELKFLNFNIIPYSQRRNKFEPGLSIIDVLMFNPPFTVNQMLDNYVTL